MLGGSWLQARLLRLACFRMSLGRLLSVYLLSRGRRRAAVAADLLRLRHAAFLSTGAARRRP